MYRIVHTKLIAVSMWYKLDMLPSKNKILLLLLLLLMYMCMYRIVYTKLSFSLLSQCGINWICYLCK